jgi:hypothetical protein
MSSPVRVYFDTNAWSYLLEPRVPWTEAPLRALRDALADALRDGVIRVLGSCYLIEEASRLRDAGRRAARLSYFWDTVGQSMLLPVDELARLELANLRPLAADDCFVAAERLDRLRSALGQGETLDLVARGLEERLTSLGAVERGRRDESVSRLRESLPTLTPHRVMQHWWAAPEARVEDWVGDYIRAETGRNPHQRAQAYRTIWAMHAYKMGRMVQTVGAGERPDPNDIVDAQHYASACWADVLVTDDAGMQRTAAAAPRPGVPVVCCLEQFALGLGIHPTPAETSGGVA